MKQNIKRMKAELKELAQSIKDKKKHRKDRNADGTAGSGYVPGLLGDRNVFRHKHVAYCLARGRTLEQCDSGKGLDMKVVEWYMTSMKEESTEKLYVVVNDKLSPSQQAVQAGHAIAAFLLKHPNTQWQNGHLVYLKDTPNWQDNMYFSWLQNCSLHQYAEFKEPDVGNKITAYACFGPHTGGAMKGKKLV